MVFAGVRCYIQGRFLKRKSGRKLMAGSGMRLALLCAVLLTETQGFSGFPVTPWAACGPARASHGFHATVILTLPTLLPLQTRDAPPQMRTPGSAPFSVMALAANLRGIRLCGPARLWRSFNIYSLPAQAYSVGARPILGTGSFG